MWNPYIREFHNSTNNSVMNNTFNHKIQNYLKESEWSEESEIKRENIVSKARLDLEQLKYQQLIKSINNLKDNTRNRDDKKQLWKLINDLLDNTGKSSNNHEYHEWHNHEINRNRKFSSTISIVNPDERFKLTNLNRSYISNTEYQYNMSFIDQFWNSLVKRIVEKRLIIEYKWWEQLTYTFDNKVYTINLKKEFKKWNIEKHWNYIYYSNQLEISEYTKSKIELIVKIQLFKKGYNY